MFGLNIHLKSFKLSPSLVNANDKIRVSITTFPELHKEAFVTEAKQMNFIHHFFTINVTEKTKKIVFVFRKLRFFDQPIIASTQINAKDLPTTDETIAEMKTIKIFEPIQFNNNNNKDRKEFGEMQVQLSLTSAFPTFESIDNNQKITKVQRSPEINSYSKTNSDQSRKRSLFVDEYCN